ncbi:MAG TPA: hypothetical protein EYH17_02165, partial [Pyrodictium sp.]|nr:hypothetical protein [Pyrodictium sp.]
MKNLKLFVLFMFIVFATFAHADLRNFTQRYTKSLKGNLKVIGNTVLESIDGYTYPNSYVRLRYVGVDGDYRTFNSSSATINTAEAGVDISASRIKWAGLYWQGYLHTNDGDLGIDSQYDIANSQTTAHAQILEIINSHSVSLQRGTNSAHKVTPDKVDWHIQYNKRNYVAYKYSAFANVTSLLQDQSPSARYTIANIPTREGRTNKGSHRDRLGNYGAWSLVIVYDNNTSLAEKTRNISVFDGYLVIDNTTQQIDIPASGFKTPKNAPNGVDSTLSVFAAKGDKTYTGDFLELINQDDLNYRLASSDGTNNFFNSSIEGVPIRNPSLPNNMGIDIHTQQVGTSAGSSMPIKTNHTNATIRIGTAGDHFMPSMVAFATEFYSPK